LAVLPFSKTIQCPTAPRGASLSPTPLAAQFRSLVRHRVPGRLGGRSADAGQFGVGAQQQLSKSTLWGSAAEYLYGGSLDTNLQSMPVALAGRGDLAGTYDNLGTIVVAAYCSWQF
jgi:hypothetical protein